MDWVFSGKPVMKPNTDCAALFFCELDMTSHLEDAYVRGGRFKDKTWMTCGEATVVGCLHETAGRTCHYNLSSFEDVVERDRYESSVGSLKSLVGGMDRTDDAGS
jgi:hypothetical protein